MLLKLKDVNDLNQEFATEREFENIIQLKSVSLWEFDPMASYKFFN